MEGVGKGVGRWGEGEELGKTEGVGVSNGGRQSVGFWRQRSSATLTLQSGLGVCFCGFIIYKYVVVFLPIETVSAAAPRKLPSRVSARRRTV